tara:strand:+ start:13484 stop:14119 length:636 start_codon:yes stop_codon:yes gene_type:complete
MTRWIKNEDGSIKSFEEFEKEEFKKSHYRKWDSFKKRHVWIEYGSEQHNRILENKPKGKKVESPSIQVSQDIASRWYHSNEWKKVRSEHIRSVYERNGTRRCNQCGVEGKDIRMHVDHIYPVRKFWSMRLDLNNLQDLCSNCNREKGNFVDDMIPERRLIRKNGQWVVLEVKQESFVCPDWLKDKTPFDWKEQEKPKTLKPEIIDIKKLKK